MAHTPPNRPLQRQKMAQNQTPRPNSRLRMRVRIQTHTKTPTPIPPTDYSHQHPNKHIRQNTYFPQLTNPKHHYSPCPSRTDSKQKTCRILLKQVRATRLLKEFASQFLSVPFELFTSLAKQTHKKISLQQFTLPKTWTLRRR